MPCQLTHVWVVPPAFYLPGTSALFLFACPLVVAGLAAGPAPHSAAELNFSRGVWTSAASCATSPEHRPAARLRVSTCTSYLIILCKCLVAALFADCGYKLHQNCFWIIRKKAAGDTKVYLSGVASVLREGPKASMTGSAARLPPGESERCRTARQTLCCGRCCCTPSRAGRSLSGPSPSFSCLDRSRLKSTISKNSQEKNF